MTLPDLKRLWRACAMLTLSVSVFFAYLHGCERSTSTVLAPQPSVAPASEAPPPSAPASRVEEPRYTFVGPAKLSEASETSENPVAAPKPRPAASATDTLLALGRQARTTASLGAIPDLDIRLAGVDLRRIMQQYGYVPAIKTRTRLLGKIAGPQFLPMTAAEISRYARRGRSGANHPEAGRWLRRVAAELRLPLDELQFIFLVPQTTEQIFIAAEMAAIQRAGKSPQDIALVRAHFSPDLAIVVDALVTKTGEVVPVDSVRLP